MVSFWPWKGEDKSPASFEKILSNLSTKISKSSSRIDSLRQRSRRLKVLWTLYAGFTYLLYTIILTLVVGWRKWGPTEYIAVAGGPVAVYGIRFSLTTYYEYRTSNIQNQLQALQKQRDSTIEKLKAVTRYNDTEDLLKKYSGISTTKTKPTEPSERKVNLKRDDVPEHERTVFVPPPTANIIARNGRARPTDTSQRSATSRRRALDQDTNPIFKVTPPSQGSLAPHSISAEFAPNAFPAVPQYPQAKENPRWYDRIMDALLGEDESLPIARLALICDKCRLVNGLAPPGVKRLEDVGKWQCGGCGAMNGEESEAKKIVASIKKQGSFEAEHSDRVEKGNPEIQNHDRDRGDASNSHQEGHETDVAQYSSESSDSVKRANIEPAKRKGLESSRRPSTRSQGGEKRAG